MMLEKIPQKDVEIIEQLAFNYAESVQKTATDTLATMYKKGVVAEREALIKTVLDIIDKKRPEPPTEYHFLNAQEIMEIDRKCACAVLCDEIRAEVEALKAERMMQET